MIDVRTNIKRQKKSKKKKKRRSDKRKSNWKKKMANHMIATLCSRGTSSDLNIQSEIVRLLFRSMFATVTGDE